MKSLGPSQSAISRRGVPPSNLDREVTETTLIDVQPASSGRRGKATWQPYRGGGKKNDSEKEG